MPSKGAIASVCGVVTYGEEPEVGFWECPWGIIFITVMGIEDPSCLVGRTVIWAGDLGMSKLEKGAKHWQASIHCSLLSDFGRNITSCFKLFPPQFLHQDRMCHRNSHFSSSLLLSENFIIATRKETKMPSNASEWPGIASWCYLLLHSDAKHSTDLPNKNKRELKSTD